MTATVSDFLGMVLTGIGADDDMVGQLVLGAMACVEGVGMTGFNPLDTTQPAPGSYPMPGNSAGVQRFLSLAEGVSATVQTLLNGNYPLLVRALKTITHTVRDFQDPAIQGEVSKWEGGGGAATWRLLLEDAPRVFGFTGYATPVPAPALTDGGHLSTLAVEHMLTYAIALSQALAGQDPFDAIDESYATTEAADLATQITSGKNNLQAICDPMLAAYVRAHTPASPSAVPPA